MPRTTGALALTTRRLTIACGLLLTAGCTAPSTLLSLQPPIPAQTPPTAEALFVRLQSQLAANLPDTELLSAPPGTCGPLIAPVVHLVVPERVLFATASSQPSPDAIAALDAIANLTIKDAPSAELTVLGHTDAIGSDDYNMALSERRAVTVLHALAMRGLDPNRLSSVAIGKRQPIADNLTPEGRARNRRVEFLISGCLAANLGVVAARPRDRALLAPSEDPSRPVEVMRLRPSDSAGTPLLGSIFLKVPEQARPIALQATTPPQPTAALPSVTVARPSPAPHYQPRTLVPDVQTKSLGPAVPF